MTDVGAKFNYLTKKIFQIIHSKISFRFQALTKPNEPNLINLKSYI